ncbi:MAG: YebC/PmpR family DNA-binding transcriptional regulator [Oscillospiraceae bacterium]|jgi:YebC/PmpR family DNA-binding regulatory protein|nr:YebC/PmpR family DNA-binding transcriptional regulator [Oscillospiraceae bacterium]
MSGHSKWKNIAHKKEKTDAQRAKLFTKLSREIIVCVREGGPDPAANPRLKDVIAKARSGNVPSENIKRVIERASGAGQNENFESIQYEGYGPCGVAVIVETMTDNRTRTAANVRHIFDKYGGNLGAAGCVSWSFTRKGVIAVERGEADEDTLLEDALDAGASDFSPQDEVFEIYTEPDAFSAVREALEQKGYALLDAQIEQIPDNFTAITDEEDAKRMQKLLDVMEEDDDVQNVWHNWEA